MRAVLWLGPEDGRELVATATAMRQGDVLVARWLAKGEPTPPDGSIQMQGRYELRRAPDGLADLDDDGRAGVAWRGWEGL